MLDYTGRKDPTIPKLICSPFLADLEVMQALFPSAITDIHYVGPR